jgi:hypothetical protein
MPPVLPSHVVPAQRNLFGRSDLQVHGAGLNVASLIDDVPSDLIDLNARTISSLSTAVQPLRLSSRSGNRAMRSPRQVLTP